MSELRFRMVPRTGRLEAVLAAAFVAPLLMLLLFVSTWDEMGRLARLPAFWVFIAAMASAWPMWRWTQARRARTALLTLDGDGMAMQSGLPAFWRSAVGADWQCRWAEIRSVVVLDQLGMVRITSSGRGMPILSARGMKESDLWRALDAAGVFRHAASPQHEALTFNLWKHPGTRATLVLTACLLAYGAIDSLLRREAWAGYDWRYYLPHLVLPVRKGLFDLYQVDLTAHTEAIRRFRSSR